MKNTHTKLKSTAASERRGARSSREPRKTSMGCVMGRLKRPRELDLNDYDLLP